MKSCVVIGMGRFGREVSRRLCEFGCEVMAMDLRSELVQQISSEVTHAVVADAKDKEVLRTLDVQDFDCAIVAVGDNLADSVLTTMNLKEATFRPGVRSIFNINIVGNDIYLQVESDGTWEDGGDSDISFD